MNRWGDEEPQEGQEAEQQQQQPDLTQTVQSIAQALGGIQRSQDALNNRLGFLQRKIDGIEARGGNVPQELQGQLDTVLQLVEDQKVADMTPEEQVAYYRDKSRQRPADDNEGATLTRDDLERQAADDYIAVERRMGRMAVAMGLPWNDQLRDQLKKIPVNADQSGRLNWDEWEETATGYLARAVEYVQTQAEQRSQTPARQAQQTLGSASRPAAGAMPKEPDFFSTSDEETIRYSIAMDKIQGRRR